MVDMSGVVKKKKKSLLARIIKELKLSSSGEKQLPDDVPFDDVRTNDDDLVVIATRREEIRVAKHDNTDVTVAFGSDA